MSYQDKFLFETSFDEPGAAEAGESNAAPRPSQFSHEDLARAREEGFAAGKEAGAQEAEQATERAIAQALGAIAQQLPAMAELQSGAIERQSRESIDLALTIIRKLFPRFARRHGLSEIESLVAECLGRLREEPRVVIRVADSLLDPVRERVTGIAAQCAYEGRIVLLSEDGLMPGDVRVEWADGGAERDSGQLWREIDQIIARVAVPARTRPVPREPSESAEADPVPDNAVVSA